jgi:hypothetical protein
MISVTVTPKKKKKNTQRELYNRLQQKQPRLNPKLINGSFGAIRRDHTPRQQKYKERREISSHPTSNDTTSDNRNESNIS